MRQSMVTRLMLGTLTVSACDSNDCGRRCDARDLLSPYAWTVDSGCDVAVVECRSTCDIYSASECTESGRCK